MRSMSNNGNMTFFKRKPVIQEFSLSTRLNCFSFVYVYSLAYPILSLITCSVVGQQVHNKYNPLYIEFPGYITCREDNKGRYSISDQSYKTQGIVKRYQTPAWLHCETSYYRPHASTNNGTYFSSSAFVLLVLQNKL
jgi:hypothetical protein